jgi:PAS domain S-box-containing protein
MLEEIIANPAVGHYLVTFGKGTAIFLEGDPSQDLYILVSGQLDVLKGKKGISEISEAGSLFGETSLLLGTKRTATVKAANKATALCIPKDKVAAFLNEFPDVARETSKILAHRLDEANKVIYGLKEFCDQLPDAVILTDKEGKIISWNTTAEKLYGYTWHQMRYKSAEEIYEEPERYKRCVGMCKEDPLCEKILQTKHPVKGTRFVSTSFTVLYDGHYNFQGMLSLGRDVTASQKIEEKYRRARRWLIPSSTLLILLSATLVFTYPYFSKGYRVTDERKQELRNQIAKDHLLFKSLLTDPFEAKDQLKTSQLLKDFFTIQEETSVVYTGLVLLDKEKKVFTAHSITGTIDTKKIVGSSYAGIEFQESENSPHKVLTLFRVDKDHPMGRKGIEVAFEIAKEGTFLGWLIFQMDVDALKQKFEIDEETLKRFRFQKNQ